MRQRDPAELEEGFLHGRGPSLRGKGGQFPGSVGEIDLEENGVSLQRGLLPEEETAGTVQQGDLQTAAAGNPDPPR